jgi:hypothetical protein
VKQMIRIKDKISESPQLYLLRKESDVVKFNLVNVVCYIFNPIIISRIKRYYSGMIISDSFELMSNQNVTKMISTKVRSFPTELGLNSEIHVKMKKKSYEQIFIFPSLNISV